MNPSVTPTKHEVERWLSMPVDVAGIVHGPIPELVDDQDSDDEETSPGAHSSIQMLHTAAMQLRVDEKMDSSIPELVHVDAIEDDEEVLGPIRLVSREVLDNQWHTTFHTDFMAFEGGIITESWFPLPEPSVGNAPRYDFVPPLVEDFIGECYCLGGKKYNDLWGAGQRGTSRLPSLQTSGDPTVEWEATAEIGFQKQRQKLLSK